MAQQVQGMARFGDMGTANADWLMVALTEHDYPVYVLDAHNGEMCTDFRLWRLWQYLVSPDAFSELYVSSMRNVVCKYTGYTMRQMQAALLNATL